MSIAYLCQAMVPSICRDCARFGATWASEVNLRVDCRWCNLGHSVRCLPSMLGIFDNLLGLCLGSTIEQDIVGVEFKHHINNIGRQKWPIGGYQMELIHAAYVRSWLRCDSQARISDPSGIRPEPQFKLYIGGEGFLPYDSPTSWTTTRDITSPLQERNAVSSSLICRDPHLWASNLSNLHLLN